MKRYKQLQFEDIINQVPEVKKEDTSYKGDYKLDMLNLITGETFVIYQKNEYFLRLFKNKCRFSKKVKILSIEKMY
jgi:hypothetical protein